MANERARKWLPRLLAIVLVVTAVVWGGNDLARWLQGERASVSHGSASDGSVERAVRLPSNGPNFHTYSRLGSLIGRTSVHDQVHDVVLATYASLAESHPHHEWIYGETGWPRGGEFYPHRTHQNGLIVDFMSPIQSGGRPSTLPTWPWTAWGYGLDFHETGRGHGITLDLEAVAAHLLALETAAQAHGLRIRKVILAPDLRRKMVRENGDQRLRRMPFSERPVWVRHDDHYHVEFRLVSK